MSSNLAKRLECVRLQRRFPAPATHLEAPIAHGAASETQRAPIRLASKLPMNHHRIHHEVHEDHEGQTRLFLRGLRVLRGGGSGSWFQGVAAGPKELPMYQCRSSGFSLLLRPRDSRPNKLKLELQQAAVHGPKARPVSRDWTLPMHAGTREAFGRCGC